MLICNATQRLKMFAVTGVMALSLTLPALAAPTAQVAYFRILGDGTNDGLLIEWLDAPRARVVNGFGARFGSVSGDTTQTVITFDSPFSRVEFSGEFDSCGGQPERRKDTTQIVLRDAPGRARQSTSAVLEMGTLTPLDGCDAGQTVPFGALTDPGTTMNRADMNARPSLRDLKSGTQIAGFSEQSESPDSFFLPVDVVTLYAGGTALFASSGNVVPAEFNADQWLVFRLAGFERAYARLAVDVATGAETWLRADWSNGQAQRVSADLVVKPDSRAGFGTERQASRMWESGLFSKTQLPFFVHLYPGGIGERVSKDLATGTESRAPITWSFGGKNIMQTRFSASRRDRTWVPLRNSAGRIRFVMESENLVADDGSTSPNIPPRVNFYIDTGKAVPLSEAVSVP